MPVRLPFRPVKNRLALAIVNRSNVHGHVLIALPRKNRLRQQTRETTSAEEVVILQVIDTAFVGSATAMKRTRWE